MVRGDFSGVLQLLKVGSKRSVITDLINGYVFDDGPNAHRRKSQRVVLQSDVDLVELVGDAHSLPQVAARLDQYQNINLFVS